MRYLFLGIGICVVIPIALFLLYVAVKLVTYAFYRGRHQFQQDYHLGEFCHGKEQENQGS